MGEPGASATRDEVRRLHRAPVADAPGSPGSMTLRRQRLGQLLEVEQPARQRRHVACCGIHGVGSWCSVMRSDSPCHCMPRLKTPSAPPMMRSAARNRAGPIVLANAGTSVVRLRKLVSAFCSIVSGCSRAPRRCVCAFHSASLGELGGEVRLPEGDVADPADAEHRHQLRPLLLQVGDLLGVGRQLASSGRSAAASAARCRLPSGP